MTNILFIHQSSELYGSDKMLLVLLSELDKTKFFPVVVLPDHGPLGIALQKEGIVVAVAPVAKLYRKMFTPKNLLKLGKEIKASVSILDKLDSQYHFDLVYSNTLAVLLGMIYARKRKLKHVWHVHEIIVHPKPIATLFPKLLNWFADAVVCNSQATLDNLTSRIPALKSKSTVIHNGLDPIKSDGGAIFTKESLGFAESDVIVTLVGRISRLKGHKWLLHSYAGQLKSAPIKLLFVGSPVEGQEYYLEEVEQIIEQYGLEQRVKIIPYTQNVSAIWALTDIAVMPSTEAESFGLVALEAMLSHKPVIGADHGGLTEIIEHGKTGFLVKPNDEPGLADAILTLANNPEMRESFGNAGYEVAVSKFSVQRYVDRFSTLLGTFDPQKQEQSF